MSTNAMKPDELKPELLTVDELFGHESVYTVPIYQRNYAWRATQIEQLISDIQDAVFCNKDSYFLGNLVVTPRAKPNDFEVIDGQQRLTTLYLLLSFLENDGAHPYDHHKGRLQYASRTRASEALRRVGQAAYRHGRQVQDSLTDEDGGIHEGYHIIHQTIATHEKLRHPEYRGAFADFLRSKVTVVRASLPPKTDLNRYFEIMNTRGQQLLQVDIVKARLMSKLPDAERTGFAWIWDACADMDTYVQMSLARGDTDLRSTIFGNDWFFDAFILKRQFTTSTDSEEGDWSLQRLKKNTSSATPDYPPTFRPDDKRESDAATRDALLLQSMLRITYTSPRTMHWMTQTLQWLAQHERPDTITGADLVNRLQDYARDKVAAAFFQAEEEPTDFGIARIVFTYLDYLLLDETTKGKFKFQFRTSIEHFYPQHPNKEQSGAEVTDDKLHLLGNLALVSVGANSKFSNSFPKAKAENFKDTIALQSPKLQLMAEIARRDGWGDAQVQDHHDAMRKKLEEDIRKKHP